MALMGKQLARQLSRETTGHQARTMFGAMTAALSGAYSTLASYDTAGIAEWSGLDAGSIEAARAYLDSTNTMLSGYFSQMPESSGRLTDHQFQMLTTSVSGSSVAVATIDDLFGTGWLEELCTQIVAAVGTVSSSIANGVSKVAGSFLGGTWWVWLLAGLTLVFWKRYRPDRKGEP